MDISALILEDLKLKVHLGVTATERSKKQTVLLKVGILFPKPPLACKTGKISDTVCYAKLIKKIQKFCENKRFTLIEEMGMQLLLEVKKNIPRDCKAHMRVAKQYPLRELSRSVFEIGVV
ncbi:MAG: dihydroneopterin aldolase [uncultured bacterium]|nr:MAG: dihydroneopterin aldolase [uncultured bacterium]